jgi:xanthine/uracil/vitamin C permease (AzgA family)
VVAAVTMPLTYSIATGVGLGFITYALAGAGGDLCGEVLDRVSWSLPAHAPTAAHLNRRDGVG